MTAAAGTTTAHQVLAEVQQRGDVPAARRVTAGRNLAVLIGLVDAALVAGWQRAELVEALGGSFVGARAVFGVLRARLQGLGPPPGRLPVVGVSVVPWCGERGHGAQPANGCALCRVAGLVALREAEVAARDAAGVLA